jgi:hypothetical protein
MADSLTFDRAPAAPRKGVIAFFKNAIERMVAAQSEVTKDLPPMLFRFPPL